MASWQAKQRDPLFDQTTQAALERRVKELIGAGLIVAGVLVAMMLLSYTPTTPASAPQPTSRRRTIWAGSAPISPRR